MGIRVGGFQADTGGGTLILRKDKQQNRRAVEKCANEKVIPPGLLDLLARLGRKKARASLRAAIKMRMPSTPLH